MAIKTDLQARKATAGVHGVGDGLYLRVKPSGAKSWVLRVQFQGNRRDVGLGGYPTDRTLGEAKEEAARLRKLARSGQNPVIERDRSIVAVPSFKDAVKAAEVELGKGWSDRTVKQFRASMASYATSKIGSIPVNQVGVAEIVSILEPIWTEKPQIARKIRHRTVQVLDFAKSRGWRVDATPLAKEIGGGLSRQPRPKGFAAVPYQDVPTLVAAEQAKEASPARLALLFAIFTGARSGEVRKAHWGQIDSKAKTWHRDADFMTKTNVEHTVTLNAAAMAVLDRAKEAYGEDELIFPSARGKVLSDAALGKMLRSAGRSETVHGFRKSFRNWAAEQMPHVPFAVAEMSIAHSVGTNVEKVYLTSDLRDLRRELMDHWGEYLAQ